MLRRHNHTVRPLTAVPTRQRRQAQDPKVSTHEAHYNAFLAAALEQLERFGFNPDAPDIRMRAERVAQERYEQHISLPAQGHTKSRHKYGNHDPVVYYVRLNDLVKIGTTINIGQRLTSIFVSGIMAIEFGTYDVEQQRHRQFAHIRRRGEWFDFTEELAHHILDRRAHFETTQGESVESWLVTRSPQPKQRRFSAKTPDPSPAGPAA